MRQIIARPAAITTPPRRRNTPASLASPGSSDNTMVAIDTTPIAANVIAVPAATSSSVLSTLFIDSTMCTGIRIVRAWSAIARVTAWRIHHVA